VAQQDDRHPGVVVTNHVIDEQAVVDQPPPPVTIRKVSEQIGVWAMAAMIVGNHRQPTRDCRPRKPCVSRAVFSQPMKYLDDTSNGNRCPPVCAVNRVLIGTL